MPVTPNVTWNSNIPFATNSPSVDQPNMQINNNNNILIWQADHIGFNSGPGNSGLHNSVTLFNQVGIPNTNQTGATVTYSKIVTGQTQDFETSDVGAHEYQMTRFIDASFALFGTNTAITLGNGGWTFLPGGLLLQYGNYNTPPALAVTGTITFPITFTGNPFMIQATLIAKAGGTTQAHTISVINTTVSPTTFEWNYEGTTSYTGFYWMAIGV